MTEFLSLRLEVPRGDGVGATLDASEADSSKSFVFQGARAGRFQVEGSHDGTSWATLSGRDRATALFTGPRPALRTVEGIAKLLRVRAFATRGVAPPSWIDVGALPAAAENLFATIPAPADAGLGKPIDLGAETALDKTFIVGGKLPMASRYSVLASIDGERFGEVLRFSGGAQDRTRTVAAVCRYLRLEKTGRGPGPVVTVGANGIPAVDGGGPAPVSCPRQISVSDDSAVAGDIDSDEQIMREYFVPLASLGGRRGFEVTLSGFFAAEGSGSGQALFQVRMGGHSNTPDGEPLLELEETTDGSPRVVAATVRTRPAGATLIKLTGRSSGQKRAVVRGLVITFQSLS